MILEVVITQIKEGEEKAFEDDFKKASQYIARAKGYISHELRRCIETKGRYVNLVRWETVDDHMVGFRNSPDYQEFRALVSPHYAGPAQVEHYELSYQNPA